MLHAVIVAVAKESAEIIARMAQQSGHITVDYVFCPAESAHHLVRSMNGLSPELVLVEMGSARNASFCQLIREKAPDAVMVGFSTVEPTMLDPLWPYAPSHDQPVEPWPLTPDDLLRVTRTAMELHFPGPIENVIAILPAKAGCGASTTVLNIAGELSGSFQRKALVIEADLRSGVLSEALNITPECSLARTLGNSDMLPTLMWPQHVSEVHGIHIMPSRRESVKPLPEWYQYRRLLRFAAPRYDLTIVDLPEIINDATIEVVRLARVVYVVTTPELPSLQLARSRIAELDEVLDDPDRVRIILNRWHRSDVHPRDVGTALHRSVEAVLPNDYLSVKKAILENSCVDGNTGLGRAYHALAGFLIGEMPAPLVEQPKSKLFAALVQPHLRVARRMITGE
jgi:Mrp family chromosome partitioning ATPase